MAQAQQKVIALTPDPDAHLDDIADRVIALRGMVQTLPGPSYDWLRALMNAALLEIGRRIAHNIASSSKPD